MFRARLLGHRFVRVPSRKMCSRDLSLEPPGDRVACFVGLMDTGSIMDCGTAIVVRRIFLVLRSLAMLQDPSGAIACWVRVGGVCRGFEEHHRAKLSAARGFVDITKSSRSREMYDFSEGRY